MAKRRSHGEGTIYHRADGRWEAAISLGNGRRKRMMAKTQKEAREKLTRAQRERDQGLPITRDERQTVGVYLESWLQIAAPTVRPRTWTRYCELVHVHLAPALGRYQLAKLTPQAVQQLYATTLDTGLSATTVRRIHSCLRRALGEAVKLGIIPRNVATLVTPPKATRPEMHVLNQEQAQRFLDAAAGERLGALFVLALTTGMRQGEILALRWRDIDLAGGLLQVRATLHHRPGGEWIFAEPKTARSRRRIRLTPRTLAALKEHRRRQLAERLAAGPIWQDRGLVFCQPDGAPIDGIFLLRYRFYPLLAKAGLPRIRFHDLRHTCATLLLLRGVDAKRVQDLLGHSSIVITLDTYSHILPDMQDQVAAVMEDVLQPPKPSNDELPSELPAKP